MKPRIGFLFNHVAGHQVAHALPIAFALRQLQPDIPVTLFCAPEPLAVVQSAMKTMKAEAEGITIVRLLPPTRFTRWAQRAMQGAVPVDLVEMLARNRDKFVDLAALVTPEKTSLLLKSMFGVRDLQLIHTRHGAGDLPVGFDRASSRFDFVLVSGQKVLDQLDAKGLLKPGRYAVVGYPKFEQHPDQDASPVFDNGKPTVLYNPHPSPVFSSWFRMGSSVLDYFSKSDRYNLVFAPHVTLFRKSVSASISPPGIARVPRIPNRYFQCPNIHIDTGSKASLNMTYTNIADIYLGDASSQVYEF